MSQFTFSEFDQAFAAYSCVYNFHATTDLTLRIREVLSVPFNLQVYSEANKYEGKISLADVLPENVVHLYFGRK